MHRLDSRPTAENDRGLVGDLYDFDFPQPGSVAAAVLERWGQGRPFEMSSQRRQPVSALSASDPAGQLTLEQVRWGQIR